ncbi:hypothetical protein LXA43DRAFT_1091823 [Ganoderma leucocontextum]|nr:hypothetical protein LXA43DRAFT_1091823 [Ganoderma leucocontextum]
MSTTTTDFPFRPSFSPPSPPPSPTNGFSSIFQSPGGPPLILVCIAAGLLLGAFIGVLLMRRMRPPVVAHRGIGAAAFLRGLNLPLGEKPALLDIHLLPTLASGSDEEVEHGTGKQKLAEQGAWGHVSPFAAVYLPSDRPLSQSAQSPSASATASRSRSLLSRLMARMPWADPRLRSGSYELSPLTSPQLEARKVQLAVTVSMPSPQHPSYRPPSSSATRTVSGIPHDTHALTHDNHVDNPMPDCCIGTKRTAENLTSASNVAEGRQAEAERRGK